MEDLLRRALSPDPSIRVPSESQLNTLENSGNLLLPLLSLFESSSDGQLQVFSLILAKSVIQRQWHLSSPCSSATITPDQKSRIKSFLLFKLLKSPSDPLHLNHLIQCLEQVSKFDFYESWPELLNHFDEKSWNLNEVDIRVLKVLIKTQIKRRTKFRQFRDWILRIYPHLRPLWTVFNSEHFDKIIMKSLTVQKDPEMISELLSRSDSLLNTPNGEGRLRVVLKGLNLIENIFPALFTQRVLQEYLKVNYTIITNIDLKQEKYFALVRQVVYNIRQIIETNDEAALLLKSSALGILQKTSSFFNFETFWDSWAAGDYFEVLCRKKEENCIKKLLVTILTIYPECLAEVYSLVPNLHLLPFDQLYISLSLLSLIPRVNKNTSSEDLKTEEILSQLLKNQSISGYHQKFIFKKGLEIIRKSLKFIQNFDGVFSWIEFVKRSGGDDLVLIYESCLSAKEMLNFNIPAEIKERIIFEFETSRLEIKEKLEKC